MFRILSCTLVIACLAINRGSSDEPGVPRTDVHGDSLPPGALQRLGSSRWRAGGSLALCAFLPDGKSLLTVDNSFQAVVWDVATGKELRRIDISDNSASGAADKAARLPLMYTQPV